jgi:hypothetical protein
MSCCGEPANKVVPQQPTHVHHATVTQQPGLHPGLEKPQMFQQPMIPTPPPAHAQNGAPAPWGQSFSPPPVNQFGGYTPSPPQVNGQSYNGSIFNASSGFSSMNEPLVRPGSAHHPTYSTGSPPPHMSIGSSPPPKAVSPPPDEGKMSVSIDFGTSLYLIFFRLC